jgi:hypothetical protein
MRIVGKTALKSWLRIVNAPDPGPGLAVASEDAEFACIVAVPGGPILGFSGPTNVVVAEGPLPAALVATTTKVYVLFGLKPVKDIDVPVVTEVDWLVPLLMVTL